MFASAPGRFPGAPLAYAGDLNIYRNPFAQPPAWFVRSARVVPAAGHVDAVADPAFDPAAVAVVDRPVGPSSEFGRARVRRVDTPDPDRRRLDIEAPDGGLLVLSERFHEGWTLRAGDRVLPLVRADAVLMAAWVPPGTSALVLEYANPGWRAALWLSALSLAGIVVAFLRRR